MTKTLSIPSDVWGNITPAPEQVTAIELAAEKQVLIITGGPGSGKSACLKALLAMYEANDLTVALAAPTGKAAQRMAEATGAPATTLHRLMGFNLDVPVTANVLILDECFDAKQPILTEDGWQNISYLVNNKIQTRVWSLNKMTHKLELKPILRWLKNPAPQGRKLLEIVASRTKDARRGTRLARCTKTHKILTPAGYVRAGDLRVGDEVVVCGPSLSAEQHSVLVGSILGDGGANRRPPRNSAQVTLVQGDDQRAYLEFKRQVFGDLASVARQGKSGYGDKPVWYVQLAVTDDTTRLVGQMMDNGTHKSGRRRWSPTDDFLSHVDAQALAIWFLDNGSLGFRSGKVMGGYLHTQRFSREDNERFQSLLYQKFGLAVDVAPDGKGYIHLRMSQATTNALLDIIAPYTPACMAYKLPHRDASYSYLAVTSDVCNATIKSIREYQSSSPSVFDIEVADNHNYIAGNILVSNCSMCSIELIAAVVDNISVRTRLVIVGDVDQLPSIGPGRVLHDLIEVGVLPVVRLTKIFRQAEGSRINEVAREINAGICPDLTMAGTDVSFVEEDDAENAQTLIVRFYVETLKARKGFEQKDIQIIAAQKRHKTGVEALNRQVQDAVNPADPMKAELFIGAGYVARTGDRVIQKSNNYDIDGGVFNGETGVVEQLNPKGISVSSVVKTSTSAPTPKGKRRKKTATIVMVVDFGDRRVGYTAEEARDLHLSYAVTVHSFQGSASPCVIFACHSEHQFMLRRALVYTALTRASKFCLFVGQREALAKAVANTKGTERRTTLQEQLATAMEDAR